MNAYFTIINAFIEDTCVIIAVAYLLTRGRMLMLLYPRRSADRRPSYLGLILGLIGLTEIVFPRARFPYVTHTLIVTYAALNGGLAVGLVSAAVVVLGAFAVQAPQAAAGLAPAIVVSALLGEAVRRVLGQRHRLIGGFVAGMLAQAGARLLYLAMAWLHSTPSYSDALVSIPANGFGVMLLQLVAGDALVRAKSEQHRLEAERARALLVEAELTALRARVHPHFLFNTLTSIACLCGIAPERAEAAVLRLSQLMRRALEAHPTAPMALSEELEAVRAYLEIEQQRLGERLQVVWKVDPTCERALVPPFAVQTLVENAVGHGIAPKPGPAVITLIARPEASHALIAVADDGVGMTAEECRRALTPAGTTIHGLPILNQQLMLLYARRARLRLFSRMDVGTLAAFSVPLERQPSAIRDPRSTRQSVSGSRIAGADC